MNQDLGGNKKIDGAFSTKWPKWCLAQKERGLELNNEGAQRNEEGRGV